MKKKIILLISFIILCMIIVMGCKKDHSKSDSKETDSQSTPQPMVTEEATAGTQDVAPSPYDKVLAGSMTKEDYPRVDGSTATIPLSEAVYQMATGATPEEAANEIVHTKTSNSYYRLMNKEVDLLIVYAPSEQVLADIEKDGNQLDIKPIGKDALVFMANSSNKVDSLTHEQLVDIYSGKITNWSEVGGMDKEIQAFQRPENSGSQTLMLKLVMGDTPMMTGPNVVSYESMEGILEAMADYSNEGNTLGYSVFYYAQNMYQLPELKFMQVNGVEPSLETIYDNSYPYINEFYAVIRKDEPTDSNAHKIFDWLSGKEGQTLVKDLGYVPVSMEAGDNSDQKDLLKEDIIPDGYRFVATSYTSEEGIARGSVTIYQGKWEPVRTFENAYVQRESGLLPEDERIVIGYGVKQEDGTYAMQYGLYDLKKSEFAIPAKYTTFSPLDEEKGYYVINDRDEFSVIDRNENKLATGFYYGEGYGVSKKGDYYWIYDYKDGHDTYSIYDSDFKLVKNYNKDYTKIELFDNDGTIYFTKDMFMKHFGFQEQENDNFYDQGTDVQNQIFVVCYNGTSYVLDRKLNVLAQKPMPEDYNSYYIVYDGIFSDAYYNSDTYTETGVFYDNKGNMITDEEGHSLSRIVSDNYWRSRDKEKSEQILYDVTDHILRIYHYEDGSSRKIDLGDWENVTVNYVYQDIVIVQKTDGEQKVRIYKGNTLVDEREGQYYLGYYENAFQTDSVMLTKYSTTGLYSENLLYNSKGELIYESPCPENIISIDQKYIQLERGNYWGVMDYEGNYVIKTVKKELAND
jgi:ABC-type phosphate transport system substrate-binding protein